MNQVVYQEGRLKDKINEQEHGVYLITKGIVKYQKRFVSTAPIESKVSNKWFRDTVHQKGINQCYQQRDVAIFENPALIGFEELFRWYI